MEKQNQENQVRPYDNVEGKKKQVEAMFDNIAHKYDFLNHFLSLGIDNIWRRKTINMLAASEPGYILDVATGTGDLSFSALKKMPHLMIEAIDISKGMLEIGKKKAIKKSVDDKVKFTVGDSENLPFEDDTFDAAMVAFGVRNFENLEKGLREMNRVLKPQGRLFVLEFSKPRFFPFKQLFGFYFRYILPLIGKISSKDPKAYTYLFESVQAFPDFDDFTDIMQKSGFHSNKWRALTLGICSIYSGVK